MADNYINTFCSICGRGYHVCRSCAEQKNLNPWKTVTDSREHYKIYLALHGYRLSQNKEHAKKELLACDLSDQENFSPNVKSVIREIMSDPYFCCDEKEEVIRI